MIYNKERNGIIGKEIKKSNEILELSVQYLKLNIHWISLIAY